MRALETLLWFANLLALLAFAQPSLRERRWMRHAASVAFVIGIVQVLAEGPRWQMFPAYALTGMLMLARLPENGARLRGFAGRAGGRRTAVGLGVLGLAFSLALPVLIPVFRFARPTGLHEIGTLTYHWVDGTRPDVFAADPNRRRELMVQIWYPSKGTATDVRAAYMPDADAVTVVFARIMHKPAFIFGHFKYVTTNAIASAPAATGLPGYPVLIFLEGASGFRQMNTFQVENLVSHGYIVVAIDQPGTAADVVFPDGRQAVWSSPDPMRLIRQSYMPEEPAPTLNGKAFKDGIVAYLAKDVVFTLDQLAVLNRADPNGILTGKLDLTQVGAFGVSLGGIVVGEACRTDPRLKGCLMLDAPMATAVVNAGLRQPCMWITRDVASMRLERERAGGWSEAEIEAHQATMRAAYAGLAGPGYLVQVHGMFHSNFTDIPSWTPLASRLNLSGPIDARRAHDIVNAYSLAFFDQHLKGHPASLLEGPAARYPEVRFQTRRL